MVEELSNEQLVELYQSGEEKALDFLFEKNEGLMRSVAYEWANRTKFFASQRLDSDDFLQEARTALWHSARLWKSGRGAKFSTYAHQAIWVRCQRLTNTAGRATYKPAHVNYARENLISTSSDQLQEDLADSWQPKVFPSFLEELAVKELVSFVASLDFHSQLRYRITKEAYEALVDLGLEPHPFQECELCIKRMAKGGIFRRNSKYAELFNLELLEAGWSEELLREMLSE